MATNDSKLSSVMSRTFSSLQSPTGATGVAIGKSAVSQLIPQGVVNIQSAAFPGRYLRIDGTGVTRFTDHGLGVVNCQFGAGPSEHLKLIPQADDTFAIGSLNFPNVHLRLNGQKGEVNCQFGIGPFEKFTVRLSYLLFMRTLF